jgi:hypothetical protein
MRYFRTADADLYESIRLQLDAAWGHPTLDGQTVTCFDPAAVAPRDAAGMVLLAVNDEFCQYAAVAAVLPGLIVSGAVQEITAADYKPAVPPMS